MRHFIFVVDDVTPDQQNAITESFRNTDFGFWHHFSDAWLIQDPTDTWTVKKIRDHLATVVPGVFTIVFQVDRPTNWAGFGREKQFKWLHDEWPKGALR